MRALAPAEQHTQSAARKDQPRGPAHEHQPRRGRGKGVRLCARARPSRDHGGAAPRAGGQTRNGARCLRAAAFAAVRRAPAAHETRAKAPPLPLSDQQSQRLDSKPNTGSQRRRDSDRRSERWRVQRRRGGVGLHPGHREAQDPAGGRAARPRALQARRDRAGTSSAPRDPRALLEREAAAGPRARPRRVPGDYGRAGQCHAGSGRRRPARAR
mmetsp:Transcript_4510/g.12996  ORF Transcript_4510/g.12996 Transcript_4510/m.12996 type:complete len:213 (+) Transcript_4510:274-912(+)